MGIKVNGASAGTGFIAPPTVGVAAGATLTFQDSISSPVPTSRIWEWESWPNTLASPPALSTPTAIDSSATLTPDGTWTLKLTRTESDGTTRVYRVVICVEDVDGNYLPSPGFDPLLFPVGSAADLGWAGGAASSIGDHMLNAYVRRLRDIAVGQFVVTAGSHTVASILALLVRAIAAGAPLRFAEGTHTFDGTLALTDAHSGAHIVGAVSPSGKPLTKWVWGAAAPSTALADTPSNAFITITGTIDTSYCNTYLETAATEAQHYLHVHDALTLSAGQWVVVEGSNYVVTDEIEGSQAGLVVNRELVKVASATVASTNVPAAWPTLVHHAEGPLDGAGAPRTVKGVRPVVGVRIEGIDFVIPNATYIACGIAATYCYDFSVSHVSGGGFTRSMLYAKASQQIDWDHNHDRGGGHGVVQLISCQRWVVDRTTSESGPRRYQPYGVPQAKFSFTERCAQGRLTNFDATNGCWGIQNWGSHHVAIRDGIISNMDGTIIMPNSVAGGGGRNPNLSTIFGTGYDGGAPFVGATGTADFAVDVSLDNVQFVDCFDTVSGIADVPTAAGTGTCAVWWHDTFQGTIGDISIINLARANVYAGPDPDGNTYHHNGLWMQDVGGSIGSVSLRGLFVPFYCDGVYCDMDVEELRFDNSAGALANLSVFLMATVRMPRIHRITQTNSLVFTPTAAFADYRFKIERFVSESVEFQDVGLAYAGTAFAGNGSSPGDTNASPTSGNVAILTGTGAAAGERRIVAPAASDTGVPVLLLQAGPYFAQTGMMPVAFGGGTAVADMACNPGDILKCAGASGLLTVDNAAVPPVAKFRAVNKTSGAGPVDVERF